MSVLSLVRAPLLVVVFGLIGCETADVVDIDSDAERDAFLGDAANVIDRAFPDRVLPDLGPMDAGPDVDLASGQALYTQYCGFCHGESGEGYLADQANALSNQNFLRTATDDFLRVAIVEGRPGTPMSPWGQSNAGPLSDDDVDNIVAYIRQWQSEPSLDVHDLVVEGAAPRGRAAYNVYCADCHGESGEGTTAISLNNPWFHRTASDGMIHHAIVNGRPGTSMPAYEGMLTSQVISDLVVYIREWSVPPEERSLVEIEPNLEAAVINPNGMPAQFERRDGRFVAAADVNAAMENGEGFVLIDARPSADYLESHIEGALSIPFYRIDGYLQALPDDVFIVTYCGCPHAVSGQAADALLEAGFERVAVLDEGFYFWRDQGWPLATGVDP